MDCFDLVSQCSQPFFPVSILINLREFQHVCRIKDHFQTIAVHLFKHFYRCLQILQRMPVDRFQCHINIKPLCLFYQSGNTVHHIRMPDLLFLQAQTRIRSFCSNNGRSQDLIEFQTFFKCIYGIFPHFIVWISKIHITSQNLDFDVFFFKIFTNLFHQLRRYFLIRIDLLLIIYISISYGCFPMYARIPPSTYRMCPFTKSDASDARNTAGP